MGLTGVHADRFRTRLLRDPSFQSFIFNMTSRTERFQRKPRDSQTKNDEAPEEPEELVRFSPEEEAVSLRMSNF